MTHHPKNVLIIELNEFNVELLTTATVQHPLPALAKVLAMPRSTYKTADRYNSGFLEPWVQWVSIHAGVPASQHHIKHLGDVPDLGFTQCWETLSQHNISCGIWGVMNGAKRDAQNVKFFLPDPWTFSEHGYPDELNNLLDLPRYLSKNYRNLNKTYLLRQSVKLLKFIWRAKAKRHIFSETLQLIKNLHRFGNKHFVYISYFDYISTLLFCEYKKQTAIQCGILFLNSLAHLQHHHWREGETGITPEILLGLQTLDKLLHTLFTTFPDDAIVIHNGLSQMNTNHEKPWVLYRQKDPLAFLKALKLPVTKVEQHMTHDGHVFFASNEAKELAYEYLKNATIQNKALFHVEKNTNDACKLFYQLKFTDEITDPKIEFEYCGEKYPFFTYFDAIVTRTGRHIPIGTVFSDTLKFPDHIFNHDFNKYLFHYLKPDDFPLQESIKKESVLLDEN